MRRIYKKPISVPCNIDSQDCVMQLVTTSKGTETYEDGGGGGGGGDEEDPADEPALVIRYREGSLWDEVW